MCLCGRNRSREFSNGYPSSGKPSTKGFISNISERIAYRMRDLNAPVKMDMRVIEDDSIVPKTPSEAEPSYEFDSGGLKHYLPPSDLLPDVVTREMSTQEVMDADEDSGLYDLSKGKKTIKNPFVSWFSSKIFGSRPTASLTSKVSSGKKTRKIIQRPTGGMGSRVIKKISSQASVDAKSSRLTANPMNNLSDNTIETT